MTAFPDDTSPRRVARGPKILTLADRMTPEQVGGKFYRQSVMSRSGIAIPPFFCLTAAFYEEVAASLSPAIRSILSRVNFEESEGLGQRLEEASEAIHDIFRRIRFTKEQEALITKAFDRCFPGNPLVSVRSSMIGYRAEESEDSADNPFAGMSESFLYVRREDLFGRILECMASGFKAESILYRQKQGMDLMGFSVAVGVQKMIFGTRSFVLFTCDPKTAARETVVIAGHGIGEGIVQEKVPVDHFFFNPMSNAIRKEVVSKDRMLTLAPAGYGLTTVEVPPEKRDTPCLSDEEILQLAALGGRIERIFKAPQDIEGTFTDDGKLWILQSRPIAMDRRRQRVWTNANVTESFPGVTTPLTFTLARYFYRVIFYDCYRMLGIPRAELHDQHEALDRMIGFLGGRVYYCLTSFYLLHSQSPLFPIFRSHWEKMMGFLASYEIRGESVWKRAAQRVKALLRLTKAVIVIIWRFLTHERDIVRFHEWWEGLIAPRRGRSYDNVDPIVAISDFHEVWRQVGNRWGITLMNDTYLPVLYGWVEGLFKKWKLNSGSEGEGLLSGLLCGDDGLLSVEIILSAVRLAEQVRSDPELLQKFQAETPERLWEMLEAGELNPAFCKAVQYHLHLYGDRGFQELKIEQPNLRHTPWVLLRMLRSYVKDGITESAYRSKEQEARRRADAELSRLLRGHPFRKLLLKAVLWKLRKLIRNRENSRYCRSELFSFSKSVFTGIGHYLVREGKLRSLDDVYYLTQDEIFGYIDGTGVTENLQAFADLRRAEAEQNRQRETDMQITTVGPLRQNNLYSVATAGSEGNILRGLGSSAGKVRGRARIVIDPNQPVQLGDDGILIARETDPGWLFLMLSSKAIVVERGSMLSHTAITGRKFGIPTVVSLPHATTRIPDGAEIEVDGASGVVTILSEAGAAKGAGK